MTYREAANTLKRNLLLDSPLLNSFILPKSFVNALELAVVLLEKEAKKYEEAEPVEVKDI